MDLYSHYKLTFNITQYHNFSTTEVENMIPFERDLFLEMIVEKIEKKKNKNKTEIGDQWL